MRTKPGKIINALFKEGFSVKRNPEAIKTMTNRTFKKKLKIIKDASLTDSIPVKTPLVPNASPVIDKSTNTLEALRNAGPQGASAASVQDAASGASIIDDAINASDSVDSAVNLDAIREAGPLGDSGETKKKRSWKGRAIRAVGRGAKAVAVGTFNTSVNTTTAAVKGFNKYAVPILEVPTKMTERVVGTAAGAAVNVAGKAVGLTGKGLGHALFKENTDNIHNMMPIQARKFSWAALVPAAGATVIGGAVLDRSNAHKLGYISYNDGPARMTAPQTNGMIQAVRSLSNGDPRVFNELASQGMKSSDIYTKIDDYGATGDLVFALHNAR